MPFTNAWLTRVVEAALSFFVATFVPLFINQLHSGHVGNLSALWDALIVAGAGAILATIKHFSGFTALTVKAPGSRQAPELNPNRH